MSLPALKRKGRLKQKLRRKPTAKRRRHEWRQSVQLKQKLRRKPTAKRRRHVKHEPPLVRLFLKLFPALGTDLLGLPLLDRCLKIRRL
jgi:hypothetical protein